MFGVIKLSERTTGLNPSRYNLFLLLIRDKKCSVFLRWVYKERRNSPVPIFYKLFLILHSEYYTYKYCKFSDLNVLCPIIFVFKLRTF